MRTLERSAVGAYDWNIAIACQPLPPITLPNQDAHLYTELARTMPMHFSDCLLELVLFQEHRAF